MKVGDLSEPPHVKITKYFEGLILLMVVPNYVVSIFIL